MQLNKKKKPVAVDETGKEITFTTNTNTVIYDITKGGAVAEALTEGDVITVYTDRDGIARIIFIQG